MNGSVRVKGLVRSYSMNDVSSLSEEKYSGGKPKGLEDLGPDLIRHIAGWINAREVIFLSSTCKSLYSSCQELRSKALLTGALSVTCKAFGVKKKLGCRYQQACLSTDSVEVVPLVQRVCKGIRMATGPSYSSDLEMVQCILSCLQKHKGFKALEDQEERAIKHAMASMLVKRINIQEEYPIAQASDTFSALIRSKVPASLRRVCIAHMNPIVLSLLGSSQEDSSLLIPLLKGTVQLGVSADVLAYLEGFWNMKASTNASLGLFSILKTFINKYPSERGALKSVLEKAASSEHGQAMRTDILYAIALIDCGPKGLTSTPPKVIEIFDPVFLEDTPPVWSEVCDSIGEELGLCLTGLTSDAYLSTPRPGNTTDWSVAKRQWAAIKKALERKLSASSETASN